MSSKPIIQVDGISKAYKISHQLQRNSNPTLRDDLVMMARKPLSWIGASGGLDKETLWALKDVSFKVDEGEVIGIMGRNGSGKSTLFKILSRITHPTEGSATLRGRTASLLEVGTGFHPELSGRENVFFNGAILGMPKAEIDKKFQQIVDFSEVEKFLDTPVKFYSSGMKVRLAFSVAAFLSSEILIIDEVLAVGDVRFKKKSLDHMKKIAEQDGRTILFVSHVINKIEAICTRGIILDDGKLVLDGQLDSAIDKYLELNETFEDVGDDSAGVTKDGRDNTVGDELTYENLKLDVSTDNQSPELTVRFDVKNLQGKDIQNVRVVVMIVDQMGHNVALVHSDRSNQLVDFKASQSKKKLQVKLPHLNLVPDRYSINLALMNNDNEDIFFRHYGAANFEIPDYEAFGAHFTKIRGGQPPMAVEFKVEE
ncbi:MAG: ABC transporter ATP-binding protein [Candidatus Saccharimonadales bacterium]|nr:ABC transporter ATP-binding protein [Candidatus Saccharimonadales bacterium]